MIELLMLILFLVGAFIALAYFVGAIIGAVYLAVLALPVVIYVALAVIILVISLAFLGFISSLLPEYGKNILSVALWALILGFIYWKNKKSSS